MSDVIDFYQQQANEYRSSHAWIAELQQKSLDDLCVRHFPNRQDEAWKYTSTDAFLKQRFHTTNHQASEVGSKGCPIPCYSLTLHQGVPVDLVSLQAQLPHGVLVMTIHDALETQAPLTHHFLGKIIRHEHGFQALNTAMLQHGVFIYVPAGIVVDMPLWVTYTQENDQEATYLRNLVVVEDAGGLTMIEDYQGSDQACYFTNAMTEVKLGESSKFTHYKVQREGKQAYHFSDFGVQLSRRSQCESHLFNLGGQWVRTDSTVQFLESGAQCLLNGIYTPSEKQHMDQHTTIFHDVPDCESEQDYKGILSGYGRAVFNGKVVVAKDAQHSQAKQSNKNLVLSSTAEIDTKPQLDIYADDVVCTHGATVGQLDEEALFYFATRGISVDEASSYLIGAFMEHNLQRIQEPKFASWLRSLITTKN